MAQSGKSPNRRHVTPHPAGGWQVVAPSAERASVRSVTQREAEIAARRIVTNLGGGEVTTHGRDGQIRKSDTVGGGSDPFPPRDKR